MSKRISDETLTGSVVWAAAERIGKMVNREELERICDYLVNKNWFQTAGDLRAARQVASEWQALEVPARLKIAIQQVLDESAPEYQSSSYFGLQANVRLTLQPTRAEVAAAYEQQSPQEQWWGQLEATTTDLNANAYNYAGSSGGGGANASEAAYEYAPPSYGGHDPAQGDTSEHYYYYDPATASYTEWHSGESEAAVEGNYDPSSEQTPCEGAVQGNRSEDDVEVVEAEAVVVEEGQIAHNTPEVWTAKQYKSTWSCGQCTFANPINEAFCEMCMGHVSLSPDFASIGSNSEATVDESALSLATDAYTAGAVDLPPPVLSPPCIVDSGVANSSVEAAFVPSSAGGSLLGPESVVPPPVSIVAQPSSATWTMMQSPHAAGGIGFSPPMSPAYAPSAPEFDQEDGCVSQGAQPVLQDGATRLPAPTASNLPAGRCELKDGSSGSVKVDPVDFLALAFQRKRPNDNIATTSTTEKTHQTRREESADYV